MTSAERYERTFVSDQRGFTLPELMVATVLTMIVTASALTALQQSNRASEAGAIMTDVNQNLRIAMNLVIRDLLETGDGIPTGGIPIPSGTGAEDIVRPGPPGANWFFDTNWVTAPAVIPGAGIGPIINYTNTDALTMLFEDHRLDLRPSIAPFIQSIATDGSSITISNSVPIGDPSIGIKAGDLIMLSSGASNAIQEVTSVVGQVIYFAATDVSKLNQRTAPAGSVLQLRNPDNTWPSISAKRISMISYYLYVPTSGPITSPHLIRRINYSAERVVAIGVENIQLTWDLVDGVTNPTNIENPTGANSPNQIRKANLYMAARSLSTFSQTGQFLRANLTTQVSLRAMAFVDRYQ
jgi:prepilin-type N-terminal cleavage/methylation domain-containing protein